MTQPPWPPPQTPLPGYAPVQPPRRRGRFLVGVGLFAAGLTIGGVATALVVGAAEDEPATRSVKGKRVSIGDLRPGQCFQDPQRDSADDEGEAPWSVRVVPCDTYHDSEVVSTYDVDFDSWPGEEKLDASVERSCDRAFEKYVGEPYDDSPYESWWYVPSKESFQDDDDRLVICLVSPPVGDVDRSAKGHTFGNGEGA